MKIKLLLMGVILVFCCVGCTKKEENHYTKEQILEICGLDGKGEFSDDGNTFYYQMFEDKKDNYTYIGILFEESEYKGYRFYIFDSENDAKQEFKRQRKEKYIKDDGFEAGDNYLCGWEADVYDASIKSFVYQTGNILIEYGDEVIGSFNSQEQWQEWHDAYYAPEAVKAREEECDRIHNKIMSEW